MAILIVVVMLPLRGSVQWLPLLCPLLLLCCCGVIRVRVSAVCGICGVRSSTKWLNTRDWCDKKKVHLWNQTLDPLDKNLGK